MHTKLMIINMDDDTNNNNYPSPNMPSGSTTPPPPHETSFQVSDFFELSDWIEEGNPMFTSISPGYNPQNQDYSPDDGIGANSSGNSSISISNSNFQEGTISRDGGSGREKKEVREKVAFKTKSEVEVLDDGFKWRKYGKKMVKNSPNPRNYYRCSVEGCPVKKRVERDNDDPRYVVTTYEGIHNHLQGPQL